MSVVVGVPAEAGHPSAAMPVNPTELGELVGECGAAMRDSVNDHVRLAELGDHLAVLETRRSEAEERWLELAAEVEERGLEL